MSMTLPKEMPRIARLRVNHFLIFDSFLLMFYTALVYVWGLTVHPMGRDYAAMASNGADLPFLADRLFAWEMRVFGDAIVLYHLVNLAALYACVWCVMHLTTFTVRGLWWLGTWAAAMFMANPIHTESVMNISGIGDTIPAFFGLLALAAYAYHAYKPRKWTYAFSFVTLAFASIAYPRFALLFVVLVMFEVLITRPENRNFSRLIPMTVIGMGASIYHWPVLRESAFDPGAWFSPLYFTFYSIGFLPENAAAMHHRPWLGWCAALAVFVILWLIYRKARRPALLFAVLAMVVLRIFPTGRAVDPVHLIGGGDLIVEAGLFTVAFAALAYRCMDHPKWRVPIIGMTTAFAIAAFLVQIRAELNWRAASAEVKAFQAAAENREEPIAVIPDWQYYKGAPLQLSESIRYETPFSRAVPHESVVKLNAASLDDGAVALESWDQSGGVLRIHSARPVEVVPWPYLARKVGESLSEGVTIQAVDKQGFTLAVTGEGLSPTTLPARISLREEPAGDAEAGAGDEEAGE